MTTLSSIGCINKGAFSLELLDIVQSRLSPRRFAHTLGCAECARTLALRFGADADAAYTAGLLHDITREISYDNQLKLCKKHDIILDIISKETAPLLHAITGAAIARYEFHVSDDIYDAIRYHTTGRAKMSLLERILWLADMIEPGRDFHGICKIREFAEKDINRAILEGINHTFLYLIPQDLKIHTSMLDARNWILTLISDIEVK